MNYLPSQKYICVLKIISYITIIILTYVKVFNPKDII